MGVRCHLGNQDIVPLDGVTRLLGGFVSVGDLPHHLGCVPDDRLDLLLSLDCLRMAAERAVDQPQVVDSFHAVSLHPDGLQIVLLRFLLLLLDEATIAFVHQSFRVLSVRLDRQLSLVLGLPIVLLQEIQERNVGCSPAPQLFVFHFEGLEHLDGSIEIFLLEKLCSLCHL